VTGAVGGQVLANATVGAGVIMLALMGYSRGDTRATPAPHARRRSSCRAVAMPRSL
jgi:hypothetical protein